MKNEILFLSAVTFLAVIFLGVIGIYLIAGLVALSGVFAVVFMYNESKKMNELKNFLVEFKDGSSEIVTAQNYNQVRNSLGFLKLMEVKEIKSKK